MEKRKTRFTSALLLFVFLFLSLLPAASADRIPQNKPKNYKGAMRVVWCKEWISLRAEPSKTSERLAEIPLGSIVYSCVDIGDDKFYQCEYEGQTGYALIGYLWPAPECEPPLSASITIGKVEAVGEERGLQDVVVLQVAHFSVISIDDRLEAKPEVWVACAVCVLAKVVRVATVAVVRLVWREVPVEPYREACRLQSPEQAQLAVVAYVARVPVLHVPPRLLFSNRKLFSAF